MEGIEKDLVAAKDRILKLDDRRERLKKTVLRAIKCDEILERKGNLLRDFVKNVENLRESMIDLHEGKNLPSSDDLDSGWFELQYDNYWEIKKHFKDCIKRDGCRNRQWCVVDVVKIFIEIFVDTYPGAVKLEPKHQRVYFYSSEKNDYVRFDTPLKFRNATSKLGNIFNALVKSYIRRVNREKKGHAGILHDKGLDVIAPYCAFNYWDFEDHKTDFVKPVKIYDDRKLVYLLNSGVDEFRKKFPRLYKCGLSEA